MVKDQDSFAMKTSESTKVEQRISTLGREGDGGLDEGELSARETLARRWKHFGQLFVTHLRWGLAVGF